MCIVFTLELWKQFDTYFVWQVDMRQSIYFINVLFNFHYIGHMIQDKMFAASQGVDANHDFYLNPLLHFLNV